MTDKAPPVQAGIDPLVAWVEQMRDKYGRASGTENEEGQWDMAQRILPKLRSQAERIAALEVERDSWKEAALSDDATAVDLLKAAKADLAEAREALENAAGFLDTPISRRRNQGDSFFLETVKSIRATLSRLKPGEKGGE